MHTRQKGEFGNKALSLAEAARLLGFSARHVRSLVDAGALPAERTGAVTGTRWKLNRAAVEQFAAGRSK